MKKPEKLKSAFQAYTVGRSLGQGGAGYVYEVVSDDGVVYAAKVLDPDKANAERLKRFRNEYEFCSRCSHRNIVPANDRGLTDAGTPFFIMPLFDSSLRKFIGELPPDRAIKIFGEILDGVEAAHFHRVVHRDLKPENVLIREESKEVAVADFGIARFTKEDFFTTVETKAGTRLANVNYAAPEQRVRGGTVDSRADIYALGLILNELFTGKLAVGSNPPTIGSVAEEYSFLDPVVDRMLQHDPRKRFSTIEELKDSIRGRQQIHLEAQKLDDLRKRVVPEGEVIDPLVLDPPRIISPDWNHNVLRIRFQQDVTTEWLNVLHRIRDHYGISWVEGSGPETVMISLPRSKEACIPVSSGDAERALQHFKDWLPRVNTVYANNVRQKMETEQRQKRRALEAEIAAAEERKKVLAQLTV